MRLSPFFTLDEFTRSQTAMRLCLPNTPDDRQRKNLQNLCRHILEPLRQAHKAPIMISSGYRSIELNRHIGGSDGSQHCQGQAADIYSSKLKARELAAFISQLDLPFDQLIYEGGWIHISYSKKSRRQLLTARFTGNGVQYLEGIV